MKAARLSRTKQRRSYSQALAVVRIHAPQRLHEFLKFESVALLERMCPALQLFPARLTSAGVETQHDHVAGLVRGQAGAGGRECRFDASEGALEALVVRPEIGDQ